MTKNLNRNCIEKVEVLTFYTIPMRFFSWSIGGQSFSTGCARV